MFGSNKINGHGAANKIFGGEAQKKEEEAAGEAGDPKEQLQQAIEAIVKQALEQALSGLQSQSAPESSRSSQQG